MQKRALEVNIKWPHVIFTGNLLYRLRIRPLTRVNKNRSLIKKVSG